MLDLRWPATALALTLALIPSAASAADMFQPTRSPKLVERAHTIDVVMAADRATMTVRRTVHNGGERHDQATFWIELPEAAVATGLRTLATVKGKPVWYDGVLMEAEAAAHKYEELTGIGGYYPKDPALLSWRDQSLLALQVFPCPPREDKTVEYTLTLPLEYHKGRASLDLSRIGTAAIAADVRVRPVDPRDQILIDGAPVAAGARLRWPGNVDDDDDFDDDFDDDDRHNHEVRVSLARRDPPRLSGRVASVFIRDDRHLREFEIDAAPRLSAAPKGAYVVIVVDTSRSQGDDAIKASITAAGHALAGLPGAHVEVVTFDRQATPVFGRFLPVAAAQAALADLAPARHNGSDVDVALAQAAALLRKAPRGAPRRVLLLTDTLTRESLSIERLRGALALTGALVHVGVAVDGYRSELSRDDAHDWSDAVRSTGGLVWSAMVGETERPRRAQRVFEEWARPLRIDHLKVRAPGLVADDLAHLPETLDEGERLEDLRLHAAAQPWVRIEGELWAAPLREVFTADPAHGRLWSALIFGSELLGELTEDEMMPLALHGGAVSPVTSYLAIEPGVRPSTEGLDDFETGGLGLMGAGSGGGGSGTGTIGLGGVDPQSWLTQNLARLRGACAAPPLALTMESTLDEVVAVAVTLTGPADPVSARCVEEGVWGWDLSYVFKDRWKRYQVKA